MSSIRQFLKFAAQKVTEVRPVIRRPSSHIVRTLNSSTHSSRPNTSLKTSQSVFKQSFLSRNSLKLAAGFSLGYLLFHGMKKENKQIDSMKKSSDIEKFGFNQRQLMIAAIWWAQYLPGMSNISFAKINSHPDLSLSNVANIYRSTCQKNSNKIITEDQYYLFVSNLITEMKNRKMSSRHVLNFLQIGEDWGYRSDEIIKKSAREAGIDPNSFSALFKVAMRIYPNGHIQINDNQVYCTNPSITHYDAKLSFERAPFMKISGNPFRVIEIPKKLVTNKLLSGHITNPKKFEFNDARKTDAIDEEINTVYTAIHLRYFKGSQAEFLNLTNEELISILQDRSQLQRLFKEDTSIVYHQKKNDLIGSDSYTYLGNVTTELLSYVDNYYQHTTGVVRVLSAPQAGTIMLNGFLYPIIPKAFLISRGNGMISHLSYDTRFSAILCDQDGNTLQQKEFTPGMDIPLLEQPQSELETQIHRLRR